MNSTEHFIAAGITASIVDAIIQKSKNGQVDIRRSIGFGFLGGLVGLLPDILEPANNPNHRGTCHSVATGIGLILLINNIKNNQNMSAESKEVWISIISAYGSHLVLDAQTPKSLPLI